MTDKLIMAGFGGQGVMLMGELLAYGAMRQKKEVTFMPSYGPEMRGGTANCSVIISDAPISSPIVENPTVLIAMNGPSLAKFEQAVSPGGLIFYNDSLFHPSEARDDVDYIPVDCVRIAREVQSEKVSNMVMLGAVIRRTGILSEESVASAIVSKFSGDKENFIPVNKKALAAWQCLEKAG